jgi:hypothetical protein
VRGAERSGSYPMIVLASFADLEWHFEEPLYFAAREFEGGVVDTGV